MCSIPPDRSLVTTALIRGHRIAVFFTKQRNAKDVEVTAEYHFVRSPKETDEIPTIALCVMSKSNADDPIRMAGGTFPLEEVCRIATEKSPRAYPAFVRTDTKVYPSSWHPRLISEQERRKLEASIDIDELQAAAKAFEHVAASGPIEGSTIVSSPESPSREDIEREKVDRLLSRFSSTGRQTKTVRFS